MRWVVQELKRRRVLKTAALYVAIAWAATEMLGFLLPALGFPGWTITIVAILFVLGFPVVIFLAWFFDVNADGIRRTEPSSARGKLTISVAATILIVSTAGLFYLIYPNGSEVGAQAIARVFDPPDNSIAVLPFVNMSDDPRNQYFSDGISEELLHRLTRNGHLWVTARTSSFQYRDKTLDVRTIGEQLNVAKILEGSVRKAGDRVRITVQLINTKDGYHDWSESYDRELTDIFQIQDDIADSVSDELTVKMAVASREITTAAVQSFSGDLTTYDGYLRARHLLHRDAKPDVPGSIELLEEVVASDPEFAAAWLSLADAYAKSASSSGAADSLVLNAARKALEADPSMGEAHALIAGVYQRRWNWLEAEREFRRALALMPRDASLHGAYGVFLAQVGATQRSLSQLSTAQERDPMAAQVHEDLARVLLIRNELDSALNHAEQAKARGVRGWRNDDTIARILVQQKKLEEAKVLVREFRQIHGAWFWPEQLLSALENQSLSPSAASELAKMEMSGQLAPGRAVIYFSLLGELDSAYQSAATSLASRTLEFDDLWGLELVGFRNSAAFADLLGKSGLQEYWQSYGLPDACTPVGQTTPCQW